MRLDKFLKVSRIIKRRPLAKQMCDGGRIKINDHPAKAGREVRAGDKVAVQFGHKKVIFEIIEVPEKSVSKKEASEIYRVIEEVFTGERQ